MARAFDPETMHATIRSWYEQSSEYRAMLRRDDHWDDLSERVARDAHMHYFPVRFGAWFLKALGKVAYFNNNPYAADPFRRDRELLAIRGRLEGLGIRELGCGFWPPASFDPPRLPSTPMPSGWSGPWPLPGLDGRQHPDYTYAVVLDATLHDVGAVRAAQRWAFLMDLV